MAQLPPPQAAAPASPDPADQDTQAGGTSVTVTDNGDGTYTVAMSDGDDQGGAPEQDDGDEAAEQPQTVQSLADACKLMEQMFGGTQDPKAAWAAEAAQRGPSGMPQQPQMSM